MAGINSSTLAGSDAASAARLTGFRVGGLVVAPLGETVALQPEIFFTRKRAGFADFGSGGGLT